jgi:hypothetical protein
MNAAKDLTRGQTVATRTQAKRLHDVAAGSDPEPPFGAGADLLAVASRAVQNRLIWRVRSDPQ